ncbi:DUF2188 domain-containing protein [Halogeometricum borinquense]|uniref:DUF2188 domain-containing protein n=2 Tax=Halogeometricum borinquense TaxID=60847 RepID=A0A482TM61_9EURY|nr:DUF2188 domain-containing protein [Halogeometricum borinquense]QIQ77623.1 DUF2188 domain-containing protein [Halogeometricum borinquense]RYJ15003.1 DUF2188 domain-containing protein [Halogeometricum borinquense]
MTRYNIMPTARGEPYDWKVEANGRKTSSHRTQQNAVDAARRRAAPGDEINVHGTGGRVRDSWTVRA